MPVVNDIARMYVRPRRVIAEKWARGFSEKSNLAYVMGGCVLAFVAQLPVASRRSHLEGVDLDMILGANILALVFIAPLMMYILALMIYGVLRVFRVSMSSLATRSILFWAFLSASPVMLLYGLVTGFIGLGPARDSVGVIWLVAFCLFIWAGISVARMTDEKDV